MQNSVQQLREAREVVSEEVTTFKVAFASCREREESGRQGLEQFGLRRQELQTRVTSLQELQSEASQSCTRLREGNVHLREKLAGMFETRDAQTGTVVRLREEFESGRARIDQQDAQLKIVRDELSALQGSCQVCNSPVGSWNSRLSICAERFWSGIGSIFGITLRRKGLGTLPESRDDLKSCVGKSNRWVRST